MGLLSEPERPGGGGFRSYGDGDARRLRFIRQAQAAGFTLEEIGEPLALDATEDRARARELARARVATRDARIAEIRRARDFLARLADDRGSGSAGPCPIITAFDTPALEGFAMVGDTNQLRSIGVGANRDRAC